MDWLTSLLGDSFEGASKIVGAIGIVFGLPVMVWRAWMGRPMAARAEAKVTGTLQQSGDGLFLTLAVSVKNIGLSRIDLTGVPPGVDIYVCRLQDVQLPGYQPKWDCVTSCMVLGGNDRIETGEAIDDQLAISLTPQLEEINKVVATRIQLTVTAKGRTWTTYTVVPVFLSSPAATPPAAAAT